MCIGQQAIQVVKANQVSELYHVSSSSTRRQACAAVQIQLSLTGLVMSLSCSDLEMSIKGGTVVVLLVADVVYTCRTANGIL